MFLLLTSNILRDLATIEADVTSHLEAVLHERLSKISRNMTQQQRLSTSPAVMSASKAILSEQQEKHDQSKKNNQQKTGKCQLTLGH